MSGNSRPVKTPAVAVWALRVGGGLALFCGALLSFVALYRLGLENGWPPYAAWAFPVCVDVLAIVAVIVAMATPRSHTASRVAHWIAGVALLMTVGCNIEYHALLPATQWSAGHIALVATGAAPALVVELIIVMQMYLGDGASLAAQDAPIAPSPRAQVARPAPKGQGALAPIAPQSGIEGAPRAILASAPAPSAPIAPAASAPGTDELARARQGADERTHAILDLMIEKGGADRVTGAMVADMLSVHPSNGKRSLAKVRDLPDLPLLLANRARETAQGADDPQPEAVTA